jgi:hypothetical protein
MVDYGGTADVAVRPFVFVNFNRLEKLEPHVLAAWTRVLIRVPSAQLHLLASPLEGCVAVTTALHAAGIAEVGTRTRLICTLPRSFYPRLNCNELILTHILALGSLGMARCRLPGNAHGAALQSASATRHPYLQLAYFGYGRTVGRPSPAYLAWCSLHFLTVFLLSLNILSALWVYTKCSANANRLF